MTYNIVMKMLKRFHLEVIGIPVLLVTFFITRLITILSVPMFTDEAIYTRWAQIANFDSSWRFISLTDGKQPSFIWLDMIAMRLIEDPLLAGRIVSVVAGAFVAIGMYFLAREVFRDDNRKLFARSIALIAMGITVFYPFLLVYDRLALYESLLAAFFVWALYFQILVVRKLRLDLAMILGFILGGGVLTKSSMFLSIYFSPFLLLLFNFKKAGLKNRFIKLTIFFVVSAVITYAIYMILRLSPYFHMINQKNAIFVYDPHSWLVMPFAQKIDIFISNSRGLFDWFFNYFTIPYVLLAFASFFLEKKFFKEKLVLLLWFLLPFMTLLVFGKTIYPRYILFMTLSLIPLVALSFYSLMQKYKNLLVRMVLILVIFVQPIWMNYFILFDFAHAPIPRLDLEQLINGWPAGGGVRESIEFFRKESEKGEIMVGTQGTFGLMPAAYEIYLKDNKNVRINGIWPVESDKLPSLLTDYAQRIPTYFVFYQSCPDCSFPGDAPKGLDLIKIASYRKGAGDTFLTIYQLKPQKENE